MRAWEIMSDQGVAGLALNQHPDLTPGPGQVLIRMRASSLNYRDLSTIENAAARGLALPMVPNSDGAGEVAALGPGVVDLEVGDSVCSCFFEDWTAGNITPAAMASALGGARPGVLAEYVVLDQRGVIKPPAHLSLEEASTLPCAALTAWHALMKPAPVTPGEVVLILGTGGVSVFAQQFCQLLGARTIVTSSSDEKLARMAALGAPGATDGINYRTTPDWEQAVLELTGGAGADRVIEVGGPGTLQRSITAVRVGGTIALIGILTGAAGAVIPTDLMRKSIDLHGIYVGSREMFAQMNKAIALHELRPAIDQVFAFEDAPKGYHTMRAASHFGKLVVAI